jgi:kynurenine formamidase
MDTTATDPPATPVPTTADLDTLYESLKTWGAWGEDDQRGTLNHLTPERAAAAARLVRTGRSISLAHDLATEPRPEHPNPVQHHMLASGDARDSNGIPGYEAARDHLALDVHGLWTTHVDALSHMFVRGQMYGGRPASDVRSDGARSNTVLSMAGGVIGRGVLLDIPRTRGVDHLGAGEVATVADLERAESVQGVAVGPGDILLVATGREHRRRETRGFDGLAGLHPGCLPWLHDREVAVLGSDGISDPMPFLGTEEWPFPVHQIGIVAMGLTLIDNVSVVELAGACAEGGRWEFLFTMAPLRIPRATGCPVNPVAVL